MANHVLVTEVVDFDAVSSFQVPLTAAQYDSPEFVETIVQRICQICDHEREQHSNIVAHPTSNPNMRVITAHYDDGMLAGAVVWTVIKPIA